MSDNWAGWPPDWPVTERFLQLPQTCRLCERQLQGTWGRGDAGRLDAPGVCRRRRGRLRGRAGAAGLRPNQTGRRRGPGGVAFDPRSPPSTTPRAVGFFYGTRRHPSPSSVRSAGGCPGSGRSRPQGRSRTIQGGVAAGRLGARAQALRSSRPGARSRGSRASRRLIPCPGAPLASRATGARRKDDRSRSLSEVLLVVTDT